MAERFEVLEKDRNGMLGTTTQVIVDKQTGVQYLFAQAGYSGGLTVLLNSDGKPLLADKQ